MQLMFCFYLFQNKKLIKHNSLTLKYSVFICILMYQSYKKKRSYPSKSVQAFICNSIIFLTISDQLLQNLKESIKSFQNLGGDVKNNNVIKDIYICVSLKFIQLPIFRTYVLLFESFNLFLVSLVILNLSSACCMSIFICCP